MDKKHFKMYGLEVSTEWRPLPREGERELFPRLTDEATSHFEKFARVMILVERKGKLDNNARTSANYNMNW